MERKAAFFVKLQGLLEEYSKIMLVGADHVGSFQMQTIRCQLRGKGMILMGKNTMIRKCIRGMMASNPNLERLLPYLKGNIGLIFCNSDFDGIRKVIAEQRVGAPAKAGTIAPQDVVIPPGGTGLEPTQTGFFQALGIPTKINRGAIEILSEVHLLAKGQKVGSSEATLLAKLNIKPFTYGLELQAVYDAGCVYSPEVLDLKDEDILSHFLDGVRNVVAASLGANFPTLASVPHHLANAYANLMAICTEIDWAFEAAEQVKKYLADPSAFAAAAPVVEAPKVEAPKETPKETPKAKVEEEEDDDGDMGLSLFD